jgi:hypothetical protein
MLRKVIMNRSPRRVLRLAVFSALALVAVLTLGCGGDPIPDDKNNVLKGKVTYHDEPFSGLKIQLNYKPDPKEPTKRVGPYHITPNADGSFICSPVPFGEVTVTVFNPYDNPKKNTDDPNKEKARSKEAKEKHKLAVSLYGKVGKKWKSVDKSELHFHVGPGEQIQEIKLD